MREVDTRSMALSLPSARRKVVLAPAPGLMHKRECVQCEHPGCSRITCITAQFCSRHLPLHTGLRVGPSTLPGAGLGLFAARDFRRETPIGYFTGALVPASIVHAPTYRSCYALELNEEWVIDCNSTQDSILRYSNDCFPAQKKRGLCRVNAGFFEGDPGLRLWAIRDIATGEEIFWHYGKSYWEVDCLTGEPTCAKCH